jgi:hypothetical protein
MIQQTPLELARLSPAAQKALGAGPARTMAARGLVPLPPADQLAVLYQLAIDQDQALANAARATATALPDKLVAGALADPKLDPRVLDLFATLSGTRPGAFEAIVGNPATDDHTIAKLADTCTADQIDRIAANEQRLLRCPDVIAAMYMNRHARMSTIDRAIELAVRNKVRVANLSAWDEIAAALQGPQAASTSDGDAVFATALEQADDDSELTQGNAEEVREEDGDQAGAEADPKKTPFEKMSVPAKVRIATLGNAFYRAQAIRSPLRIVAMAAIKASGVTEFEAARYATNQSLSADVINHIAENREWTKRYGIKVSLCRNPKTSVSAAMRMMPFLRDKDMAALMKSRGVPSAVVAQARKLMQQRRGGDKK